MRFINDETLSAIFLAFVVLCSNVRFGLRTIEAEW